MSPTTQMMFQTHAVTDRAFPGFPYDVSEDGKRLLINTALQQTTSTTPITLVQNWTAGLKK